MASEIVLLQYVTSYAYIHTYILKGPTNEQQCQHWGQTRPDHMKRSGLDTLWNSLWWEYLCWRSPGTQGQCSVVWHQNYTECWIRQPTRLNYTGRVPDQRPDQAKLHRQTECCTIQCPRRNYTDKSAGEYRHWRNPWNAFQSKFVLKLVLFIDWCLVFYVNIRETWKNNNSIIIITTAWQQGGRVELRSKNSAFETRRLKTNRIKNPN